MKFNVIFRNKKYISVTISLVLTFVLLFTGSVAWLCSIFKVEPNGEFTASSIAAYFAGGDGSKEDPYQIEKPVHIYNLSWLQYLGIFNDDADADGKIEQTYFVLNNDVDMNGMVIPPIGTEENPFIGNFNGNGCCVKDVTVSNYISQSEGDGGVSQMPSAITDIDTTITVDGSVSESKSIIGFFGVVGDWNDTLTDKITDDTQEELDIPSKVNAIYDFRLDGITIRSDTDESLMGLLAGYVNGSLQNVGIGSGALVTGSDLKPLNITGIEMQALVSHYSLIGEYNEDDVFWPNKPVLGGWGDSINMLDMYTRLSSVVWPESEAVEYVSAETVTYDINGEEISRQVTANATTNEIRVVDKGTLGNYSFSTNSDNINSTTYMYLYGPSDHNRTVTHRRPTGRVGDYIYIGSNYLSLNFNNNNTATVVSATRGNAVTWTMDSSGYLYTFHNNNYYYFNCNNNGVLSVSTAKSSSTTQWQRELNANSGLLYCSVSGVKYYLYCQNNSWVVIPETDFDKYFYKIKSGNYYLNLSETKDITNTTDAENATKWNFSETDPLGGRITTVKDGVTYYLAANRERSGWSNYTYSLEISTSSSDYVDFNGSNNNTLSYTWSSLFSSATRYIVCNNGEWSLSSDSTSLELVGQKETVYTSEDFILNFDLNILMNDEYTETKESVAYKRDTNATWFPLGIDKDENGNEYVSAGNTGYVVSSADYQHNTDAPQKSGNIRVSQYNRNTNIANSLTGGALDHTKIRSISYKTKNSGFTTFKSLEDAAATFGFTKYADSFAKFDETVKSSTSVYGLHFMQTDNNISKEHKISIDGAKILQTDGMSHTYDGYELPRNAITFNVVEDGYINFFAGTYFPGNKNFFSLHHVLRDESGKKLDSIKEISEIYGMIKNGAVDEYEPYVYKYKDNTFSDGYTAVPDGYEQIFDTKWITDANTIDMDERWVYYFEIPVNAGEYSLGSVAGDNGDGAYLLYLDLAANGSRKIADDPEHAIMGVNFVDDAGLELEDISTYPIISAQVALNDGVTTHGGVTAAFDRQSETDINYQVSGVGADSFTVVFVADKGTTATETPVTVSLANNMNAPSVMNMSLSNRRRRKIIYLI